MKRKLVTNAAVLVLVTLGALESGYAQSGQSGTRACNDKLIAGNYGVTVQGTNLAAAGPVGPQAGVAMTQFDGKGGLTQIGLSLRFISRESRNCRLRQVQPRRDS
jgi:hypothetical protein